MNGIREWYEDIDPMRSKNNHLPGVTRRDLLRMSCVLGGMGVLGSWWPSPARADSVTLPFENGQRPLRAFPEKRPLLVMTTRPPQLETPFAVFDEHDLTPNGAFFVRWHLANIPTSIDTQDFRLTVSGKVRDPLTLTLDELKQTFDPVEVTAVCQCAGNSRGFVDPRVRGGQWGHGAMGNAVWTGVRLRDVLQRAGLEANARQVRFNGLDRSVFAGTPDFVKALDLGVAMREDILVAYAMNGAPLPMLNGFPLRLVVPGWFATYWIKALTEIEILDHRDDNFWMASAYRIPANACGCIEPGQKSFDTVPIGRMPVRSLITSHRNGDRIPSGRSAHMRGIAFDSGHGIDQVLISCDGGRRWRRAKLGEDHGPYSFRRWEMTFAPEKGRSYDLQAMAVNAIGEAQPQRGLWNPGGYAWNPVETVRVKATGT